MSGSLGDTYLNDVRRMYGYYKSLAEKSMAQVSDADLHALVDPDANSIALVVKHVAGNLRSRFRDFLTTDGEKPDRDRDGEFEMPEQISRDEILTGWNQAWEITLGTLDSLTAADLERTITIRGEAFMVVEALDRSINHTAYHVGQIVLLAKHLAGSAWMSLTIPKGRSKEAHKGDFKQRLSALR
jgi:uncharacterized damage-inducible protein DinB